MLPLLLSLGASRGRLTQFPEITNEYTSNESIDPYKIQGSSRYAFVTSLSDEDDYEHEALKAAVLGYNLHLVSPNIDRILLIPTNFSISEKYEYFLSKLYSSVFRAKHIEFNCSENMLRPCDKHYWFKLNAFKITSYEKLMWIGHNNMVLRDITPIFSYPAPAAPPDYEIWGLSEFGPVHNFDLFTFKPSEQMFEKLISEACPWLSMPEHGPRSFLGTERYPDLGSYDNGLLESVFKGDITTLPQWYSFELGFQNKERVEDPKVVSVRFPVGDEPWTTPETPMKKAWMEMVTATHSSVEEPFEVSDRRIVQTKSTKYFLSLINRRIPQLVSINPIDYITSFEEFSPIGKFRTFFMALLILCVSAGFLGFSVTYSSRKL